MIHEQFYKAGLHNDIALVFLDNPIEQAENINFACLAPQDTNFDFNRCYVAGKQLNSFNFQIKHN